MKKIIFGSASALTSIAGLSALHTKEKLTISYYWFSIFLSRPPLGENEALNNSEVEFIQQSTTLSAADGPCDQVKEAQYIVGFTANQIFTTTSGSKVLKTHGVDPMVLPPSQTSKTARTSVAYVESGVF